DDGGVATAVEKDHGLLAALQTLRHFTDELLREELVFTGAAKLILHVNQFDLGQGPALYPFREFEQFVISRFPVVVGLDGGRSRSQDHSGAAQLAAHYGDVAPMIAWRLLLLVRVVVLFVDHDQGQIGNRGKDGGARADHDPRLAAADAMPLLRALVA